jgi:hypothetical protein
MGRGGHITVGIRAISSRLVRKIYFDVNLYVTSILYLES